MSNLPIIKSRYYPRLSSVISEEDIPDILGVIKTGIVNLLDRVFFKDFQFSKSDNGDAAFYSLSIVAPDRIDIELFASGITLVLNADLSGNSNISSFPITIEYQWKILAFLRAFDLNNFSVSPQEIFEVALRILNISEEEAIAHFVNNFVEPAAPGINKLQQFVTDLNTDNANWNGNPIPAPTTITTVTKVVEDIYARSGGNYATIVAFSSYLLSNDSEVTGTKVKAYFNSLVVADIDELVKDLIVPKFKASLKLIAGIEFPRSLLIPTYPENTIINGEDMSYEPMPDPAKAMFTFGEALFYADSTQGFGYNMDLVVNTLTPVQLGNTGLVLNILNLKVDLSTTSNIPEAGDRPLDFMGVYVEKAEIILPPKWFSENTSPGQAPKIFGNQLLIGTGGISGTVGLEGSGTLQYTFANDLTLELVSFDLTFENGTIVNSNVLGTITIPSFENNPLNVELTFEDGFTVKVYTTGADIPIINNENVLTTLNGLELGKSETAWKLGFVAHFLMKRELPLLSKIFPKQIDINHFLYKTDGTLEYDFHIEWLSGVTISGDHDNGVSAVFPIKLYIGKDLFQIESLLLKVSKRPDNGGLDAQVMLQGVGFDFGPVSGGIEGFGIEVGLERGTTGNNLGPFKYDLGLVGPKGVDLTIDAGPVKGSGFLYIGDHEYYGAFTLSFSKFGMGIVGILTTQLPGGKAGYSLLMIISANFGSIPIGMGFTLNGLGGLLGLHRTMNPDVLRTGIRDNTLDYILFPQDVNKGNVSSYISNIGQAFPVMEGQFMVGPMAKIGWGTPTLITIELGIILEFPEPVRLAILGVLRAILPSEDKAVLKLQINFLGIIDFTAKYLSFDASIYDSKILTFPLMGDMALRLYWGDKPNFLMSVGGFHPRYTPPPLNLPELRRLSLMLADEQNFKIGVEAYFAVSSNSVQFGAKVAAEARMWDGKINVLGALWFDILFKFNPFYFVADMGAQFAVRWKSKEILSIFINLMLEGPNPWRAQGKGTFKVIGIGVTVSFDKTFGKVVAETIDPVSLDGKFAEQLAHKDNWEALLPQRSHQQVLWKEATADEGLIVDTGGQLRFSQKLLPLNIDLDKFGTAPISDTKRFEITGYTLTQSGQAESFTTLSPAKDLFARSEYFTMSDDDKLSKDPYESFESGVFIGSGKLSSGYAVHRKIAYEDIVIDTGFREVKTNKWQLSRDLMQVHLLESYVSKSALSDFTTVGSNAAPDKIVAVNVTEERFVVVDRDSLGIVSQVFNSSAEADSFLNAQLQSGNTAANWFVANEFELV